MTVFYMVIIVLTTLLIVWAGLRVWQRLATMIDLGITHHAGMMLALPASAFLMVISAPPALLVAALAMLVALAVTPLLSERGVHSVVFLAVLLAIIPCGIPYARYLMNYPVLAVQAAGFFLWFLLTLSAAKAPDSIGNFSRAMLLSLAAVGLAGGDVLLNVAVVTSAVLGGLLAAPTWPMGMPARYALVFLLGYLQLTAALNGAWMAAAASVVLWIAALSVGARRDA